jgi:hypothetical protein
MLPRLEEYEDWRTASGPYSMNYRICGSVLGYINRWIIVGRCYDGVYWHHRNYEDLQHEHDWYVHLRRVWAAMYAQASDPLV